MFKITNTATDRTKSHLHRTAPRMDMEPFINGERLRLNGSMEVSEENLRDQQERLKELIGHGVIEIVHIASGKVLRTPEEEDRLERLAEEERLATGGSYEPQAHELPPEPVAPEPIAVAPEPVAVAQPEPELPSDEPTVAVPPVETPVEQVAAAPVTPPWEDPPMAPPPVVTPPAAPKVEQKGGGKSGRK